MNKQAWSAAAALVAATGVWLWSDGRFADPAVADCAPAGDVAAVSAAEPEREGGCAWRKHPEPADEIMAVHDMHYRRAGAVAPGALRSALAQRDAMSIAKASIAGADGTWTPYGSGNLRAPGEGYDQLAARVDNFAYDAEHRRLFAAVGSGGVWMSEAVDGEVRTLGDHWVAVSDPLPSQNIGAVAWTPAGGGTLIAAGGEAVMGSSGYLGLGAFWSDDLGASWHQASGVPDAALAFQAAVDAAHPQIVYVATSKGLFRSADAGRSYVNVRLPTTETCAGVETLGVCQFTNYVTDVVVQEPGGTTGVVCADAGCPVVAAVGFRVGSDFTFQDGTPMAPANGLYRSATGGVDSFERVDDPAVSGLSPIGFPEQARIGRIELGRAYGPEQDHNVLYALVQDAVLFNGGFPYLDLPMDNPLGLLLSSVFNGVYVSDDFGTSWVRIADLLEIIEPLSNSALVLNSLLGYQPGVQAWYNLYVQADPTRAAGGYPTRVVFGLEEVWQNRLTNVPVNGLLQQSPLDFGVIGQYYNLTSTTTTHPDQHAGIFVPTDDGGVCFFAGGDGGVFRQCADAGAELDNNGWGDGGANTGIYALLPYGLAVAKDGTVWFGLQDNGSGHIEPDTGESFMDYGADGFYAEVDPDNSDVAYTESQNGGLRRTVDRGQSWTSIAPSYTNPMFDNWFSMDPTDAQHMVTGAQEVYETASAETVSGSGWVEVFNLGSNPDTGATRTTTTMAVLGDAIYVGGCGDCGVSGNDDGFANVLATNVGGDLPPSRESGDGWHFAAAEGLPNRFITSIAIDPEDPATLYVTLGGYLSNLRPPGSYIDPNPDIGVGNVFKSTDAGAHFVNISGNLPAVHTDSVIIRDGQLLVGTDIGAFISADLDGSTWAVLGKGLPSSPVTMLRLHPGDDTRLFASTFGRHVWTYTFETAAPGDGDGGSDDDGDDAGRFGSGAFGAGSLAVLITALLASALLGRRRSALCGTRG